MDPFDLRNWPEFINAGGDPSTPAIIDQVLIDTRRIESNSSLFVALPGQQTDGHKFIKDASERGAKFALVRHDFSLDFPNENTTLLRVDSPLKALQEIASCYREKLPLKLLTVAGSYGKTMVKDLLFEMLKTKFKTAASPESYNSQIGVPLSLFQLNKEHEIGILEAAFSEKNEMDRLAKMLKPDFGVITHIGKKHLETLGDIETLVEELLKLFSKSDRLKWSLIPNSPFLSPHLLKIPGEKSFWNVQEDDAPHARKISEAHDLSIPYEITFPKEPAFSGHITSGFYYYLDLLNMCVKAAWKLGVPPKNIIEVLEHYTLEPMRREIWKSPIGVTFINDSYSEDPQSVDNAFKFVRETTGKGRKIFLFGGLRGEHLPSDFRRVGFIIAKHEVDTLCLIGKGPFNPLIETLSREHPQTTIIRSDSYGEALNFIKTTMHSDDIVLIKGDKKEPLERLTENFHESLCSNLCLVNLAAIEHNIRLIRQKILPKTRIMVMVKALAYGTDDFRIAKFLKTCGIDILGVSYVDEGVALKRGGVTQSIFVLNAADYEVAKVVKWDLEVGVSSLDFIVKLADEASKQGKKIRVHLHVDTGMSRFGCRSSEAVFLAEMIQKFPSLKLEGIMTHFATADDPLEDSFTEKQAKELEDIIHELDKRHIVVPYRHAANSSAALRFSFPAFNMIRIGLAVYGLYPSEATRQSLELRLAISLVSRIVGFNHCRLGDTISYGRSYRVDAEEKKIAVLPIGYFDGLHRNYSGRGHVIIRGQKAPMVGKICMDFMMVDVSHIQGVSMGDPVLIFGEDDYGDYLSPEDFALKGDSIVHELITCLGPRIQRIFIYEDSNSNKRGQ